MQGRTCEVVVVSYGVSDPEVAMAENEFIYDRNRLNVALSRARAKAVLVVSRPLLFPPPRPDPSSTGEMRSQSAGDRNQAHEGWRPILTRYDDGGFSGGSLD